MKFAKGDLGHALPSRKYQESVEIRVNANPRQRAEGARYSRGQTVQAPCVKVQRSGESAMNTIQFALEKNGVEQPSWKTIIVSASAEAALPRQALWEAWGQLVDWPVWSVPLHVATRWFGKRGGG